MVFMQDDGRITSAATPDYQGLAAREAGDITLTRSRQDRDLDAMPSTFDNIMNRPPAPANDNKPKARLVGLMGYGGAGKSEVAKALRGHGFTALHIKTPLRDMAAVLLRHTGYSDPEIDSYLDGDKKRDTIPALCRSGTEVQQFLGTEFGREFCYAGLWLDIWKRRARTLLDGGTSVSQESVRFPNEAAAIREMGGVIIDVKRPGIGPLSGHKSEVLPIDDPDVVIQNNGTIFDLQMQVATWLRNAA